MSESFVYLVKEFNTHKKQLYMQLSRLDIYNFRKLKECQITISDETTIFVGANNSGKTSAMFCLMNFLGKENLFTPYDFTLSNWKKINCIGEKWENTDDDNPKTAEVLLVLIKIA